MLGLVTIGEAPRDDVACAMFGAEPPPLVQTGALDELDDARVAELAPQADETLLVSRLRDGREVTLSKARLLPHLRNAISRAEQAGATVICVLCTGAFPELSASARLVFPDKLLAAAVDALAPTGVLGVLMPHDGQAATMGSKWARPGRELALATVSPYAPDASIEKAAREMQAKGVELVVLDCMGFDREVQAQVRAICDAPVLLANGLVGAVLRETLASGANAFEDAERVQMLYGAGRR